VNSTAPSAGILAAELIRVRQMMSGLTLSWPLVCIDDDALNEIERGSGADDEVLANAFRNIRGFFKRIRQPQDYGPIAQAYEEYAEAMVYLTLLERGIDVARTPGTGQLNQKRPDFVCTFNGHKIYVEVKPSIFRPGGFGTKRFRKMLLR
jgi:hypothetical protein